MSIDTEIQGDPGAIEAAGNWVKDTLAPEIGNAADTFNDARKDAEDSWNCSAGYGFVDTMGNARRKADDLERAAKDLGGKIHDFGGDLRVCQNDMATIRREARAKNLVVSGFMIHDPGPGPTQPPPVFEGTQAEIDQYNDDVDAFNAHQEKIRAYNHANFEAQRIDRKYQKACRDLQSEFTSTEHAEWIVTAADVLGSTFVAASGVALANRRNALTRQAQGLLDEANRALDEMQANPQRYLRRKWLIFKELDMERLEADRSAIESRLNQAEDLVRQGDDLAPGRASRLMRAGGRLLGPLGFGLGVYNDYQEGESWTQIGVSQGVSAAVGAGAGWAATVGTSAAVGAAVGSVIPGAGTVVGAGVGVVVGGAIAIFSDGAIDSLFENGPDVGKAFSEGVDALESTGEAIGDAASSVADTVGGWFS